MKIIRILSTLTVLLVSNLMLAACGGGGSGGGSANTPTPASVAASSLAPSSESSSSSTISSVSSFSSASSAAQSATSSTGLTPVELTQKMGTGWNLGNSLEAIGGETAWGNPVVTQQLIDAIKAAGFKTIRIPVAWSQFSDADNFVIKTAWMTRVEEVVNYALNDDLYVILNLHWDGGWMQPTYAQQTYVNNRLKITWEQIANHFRDYDERLLFAGMNEVMVTDNYNTPTLEYYTVQNSFTQTFVDTVRATGGNNANRFLVVQGFNTNIDHTVNFAKIPTDSAKSKLLMEVHFYDPYNFTLNDKSPISQWGKNAKDPNKTETWANESYVDSQFQKMKINFVDKGIGVILGEFGVISKASDPDNETYRVYWNNYISKSAVAHNMVPVYWDNGSTGNGTMGVFDRNTGTQVHADIIQAVVTAAP